MVNSVFSVHKNNCVCACNSWPYNPFL